MRPHTRRDKEKYAAKLRRNPTRAEAQLWPYLQKAFGKRAKFQAVCHGFIADFMIDDVIIELDGSIHDSIVNKHMDEKRTDILVGYGYTVIRFRNEDVYDDPAWVVKQIKREVSPRWYDRILGR